MTAKHRKGRGNNKQEENSFKHEAPERDPRRGGAPAILSVLLLTVLIGGAIVAWFCLQQHQTSANLADTLVGMQMKMVKLQALQEEVRMTADKLLTLDGFESRIQALEEVCSQVQKKVGPAVTSDLPSQVLALRAEVTQLAEWRQDAVTPEQLKVVQRTLEVRTGELESVRSELEALKASHTELAEGGPAGWRFGWKEHAKGSEDLTSLLELHAVEVTNLRRLLARHKAQLDAATRDINDVRKLLGDKPRSQTKAVQDQHVLQSEMPSTAIQDLQAAAQAQVETNQNQMGQLDVAIPEDFPSEESVVLMPEEEQSDQLVKEEEEMAHIDFAPEEDGPPGKLEASVTGAQGQEVAMTKEKELGVMEEQEMEVKEEQELGDTKQEEEVREEEELGDTKEEEEVTEEEELGDTKEEEEVTEEELADSEEEEKLGDTEWDEELEDTKKEELTDEAEFGDREEEEELRDMEEEEEKEAMEDKLKDMEEEELEHFEEEGEEEEVMEEEEELEDITEEEELEDTGEEEEEELRNTEEDKEVTEEEKLEDTEEELGHFQEEDEEEEELEDTEEEEELENTEEEDEELGNTEEDKEATEEEEPKDADRQVKWKEEMIEEKAVGDMRVVKKEEEEEQDNTEEEELGDPDAQGEEEKTTEELELEEPKVHEEEIMEERVTPVGEEEQEAPESGTEEEEQKRMAAQEKKEQ